MQVALMQSELAEEWEKQWL